MDGRGLGFKTRKPLSGAEIPLGRTDQSGREPRTESANLMVLHDLDSKRLGDLSLEQSRSPGGQVSPFSSGLWRRK